MPPQAMIVNRPRRNLQPVPPRGQVIRFEDLTMMLSITAKTLVGLAVGLLLLLAVIFAFAADLLSQPPKMSAARLRPQMKPRRARPYTDLLDANLENVSLDETGSRTLRPHSFG